MADVPIEAPPANNRRFVLIAPRPTNDGSAVFQIHPVMIAPSSAQNAMPESTDERQASDDGQSKSDDGNSSSGEAVVACSSVAEEAVVPQWGGVRCRGCHFTTTSRQAFLTHVSQAHAVPALKCANCSYFSQTASAMASHLQTECQVLDLYRKRTSTADKLLKTGGLKRKSSDDLCDVLSEEVDDVVGFDAEPRAVSQSVAYSGEARAMSPGSESTQSAVSPVGANVCSADEGLLSQEVGADNTTAGEQIWVKEESEGEEEREWKVELEHPLFPMAGADEDGQQQAETGSIDTADYESVFKSESPSEKMNHAKSATGGRLTKKRKKKRPGLLMVCPCPLCEESFDNVFYLSFHLNSQHQSEDVIRCRLCSLETSDSQEFLTHFEKCVKERVDFTDVSSKRYIMDHDILKHYAKEDDFEKKIIRMPINKSYASMMKEDGTYECTTCWAYMSVRARDMRIHISKRHTEEGKIMCKMCEYFGYDSTELREHIAANHRSQGCQMRCLRCPFQATRMLAMRLHDTYHDAAAPTLTCPHCSYTTSSEAAWQNHRRRHVLHKRRYLAEKKQRAEARKKTRSVFMSCPQCSFVANSSYALEYHTSFAHSGLAPDPDSGSDDSVAV